MKPRIAVLLPCYNEEIAIARVVEGFRAALPEAFIYVFDNASTDKTAEQARAAGAIVRSVRFRGKGNVVRRMFADVDADIYLMADGDLTYDASQAPAMIELLRNERLDIVIGARQAQANAAFPAGHRFGNWLFNAVVKSLFGRGLQDIFSGYRVMSRRFVKSFPAHSERFEVETEMSIHLLEMRLPFMEVPTAYFPRPEGSYSKLSTLKDGARILLTILFVFRDARPLLFFGGVSLLLLAGTLLLGVPLILEFQRTGLVPRLPTAVLATGLAILATLSSACGIVMDSVVRTHREALHMRYLDWPPLDPDA